MNRFQIFQVQDIEPGEFGIGIQKPCEETLGFAHGAALQWYERCNGDYRPILVCGASAIPDDPYIAVLYRWNPERRHPERVSIAEGQVV